MQISVEKRWKCFTKQKEINMPEANRVKYSTEVTFEQVEKAAPKGYQVVQNGVDKIPGRIGEGIGGEPLVILLPGDDGAWFDALIPQHEA
jgi:hypothetical protein